MAVFAGVVSGAAFHFDGDDVERRVVVKAASLRIEVEAANFDGGWRHGMARHEDSRGGVGINRRCRE
jgi:hypothetical protein